MSAPASGPQVLPYSIKTLTDVISSASAADRRDFEKKLHHDYFKEYFEEIEAKTIVVETGYIDGDYLEDFSGYYVRCFTPYKKRCTRLHFFKLAFDGIEFSRLLSGDGESVKESDLKEKYLGFVVVKPLPRTMIGRTALATYSTSEEGERHYPIKFTNEANLYGIQLKVESLPFQEQDTVAAKCATSALWVAFQGTGRRFHHPIPSPVEITKGAGTHTSLETRTLPASGLTTARMAQAIRDVGLEPFLIRARDRHVLYGSIYGYLRAEIPLILGIWLIDTSDPAFPKVMGKHAVTVTGFRLGKAATVPLAQAGLLLKATKIDRLYVHDDQVGPFARMKDDGLPVSPRDGQGVTIPGLENAFSLHTSWRGGESSIIGTARAIPDILLAPLYHKTRIPFSAVHDSIVDVDAALETVRCAGQLPLATRLEWDIFLTSVNDVKNMLLHTQTLGDGDYKHAILMQGMPKFLWCARALDGETPVFDLLFDATDIEQGNFFLRAIEYSSPACTVLRVLGKRLAALNLPTGTVRDVLQWFGSQ